MKPMPDSRGTRQQELLLALSRRKQGLPLDALADLLGISRTAVRQHLMSLERDGLVTKGASRPSGGRPEQLYVLTGKGIEQFPRQYSWFAELLLDDMNSPATGEGARMKLARLGRKVAASLAMRFEGAPRLDDRVARLAVVMNELGYDAAVVSGETRPTIEAYNCVYHELAAKNLDVCAFDLALLSACTGAEVDHVSCMVRGGGSCRFGFSPGPGKPPAA